MLAIESDGEVKHQGREAGMDEHQLLRGKSCLDHHRALRFEREARFVRSPSARMSPVKNEFMSEMNAYDGNGVHSRFQRTNSSGY